MTPYYSEDGIIVYHGDCREILPSIDPATVDLVLTDPPYGITLETRRRRPSNTLNALSRRNRWDWERHDYPLVVGDNEPFDPSHLLRFSRVVLWGANNYADRLPPSRAWLVWNRKARSRNSPDAELAWSNLPGTIQSFDYLWDGYRRDGEVGQHLHPTQKPVSLMRWILDRWTEPGDLILDPYMGSGPVAQACKELGRRYIGIEIVEDYCEVAVDRLRQGVLALEAQ